MVHDKIGPFKVTLESGASGDRGDRAGAFESFAERRRLAQSEPRERHVAGGAASREADGVTRIAGGTQMRFEASVEMLGKLATLGAIPMKRRTTQLFAEFARNIQGQFARENP